MKKIIDKWQKSILVPIIEIKDTYSDLKNARLCCHDLFSSILPHAGLGTIRKLGLIQIVYCTSMPYLRNLTH